MASKQIRIVMKYDFGELISAFERISEHTKAVAEELRALESQAEEEPAAAESQDA